MKRCVVAAVVAACVGTAGPAKADDKGALSGTWEWIVHPERRWLYSSYAASLSIRDSVKFRRLIESPWYQSRWGDRFDLTSDQNTKVRVDNSRSGMQGMSTGTGAVGDFGTPEQEIPANGTTDLQRHSHETIHYVIEGGGYSEIGPRKVQWKTGSFVYTPPWVWHRHYANAAPVRMLTIEASRDPPHREGLLLA